MKNNQPFVIVIAIVILLFSHQVSAALNCGDVITTNTTLTHDLHCSSGYYALEIGADHVTLDLNGYTLSGTRDLAGIIVYGKYQTHIKGNGGAIKGFWAGVNSADSKQLQVDETTFYDLGTGVIVASGSESLIRENDFIYIEAHGVFVANFVVDNVAHNNSIIKNEFYQNGTGIEICGDQSDNNTIDSNFIWQSKYHGIRLVRSDKNRVFNNDIIESTEVGIRIDDSSRNQLIGNSLRVGYTGLEIFADASSACSGSGAVKSSKNEYQFNHTIDFQTAIILGTGLSPNHVESNQINHNKLYNNHTGIFFNSDTYLNNATANAYSGTTVPTLDLGTGNSY